MQIKMMMIFDLMILYGKKKIKNIRIINMVSLHIQKKKVYQKQIVYQKKKMKQIKRKIK